MSWTGAATSKSLGSTVLGHQMRIISQSKLTVDCVFPGLGMDEPIGHLDFYPNGGETQPGCTHGIQKYVDMNEGSLVKGKKKKSHDLAKLFPYHKFSK